jgi:hypothetical protein
VRLILHVGTHKTGTTSIQKVLHDHARYLKTYGLYYPSSLYYRGARGHLKFSHDVARDTEQSRRNAHAFVQRIKKNANSADVTLLSSEALYRHVLGTEDVSSMIQDNYLVGRQSYVNHLAELLVDFDVEVVIYCRDYEYFLSWLYRTFVKSGGWQGSASDFKNKFFDHFAYERQFEIFRSVFPRLTIHSYENAKEHGLIRHFFGQLGFPAPPGSEVVWERPTKRPIQPIA